jgi:hypothetical protein
MVHFVLEFPDIGLARVLAQDPVVGAERARAVPVLKYRKALLPDTVSPLLAKCFIHVKELVGFGIADVDGSLDAFHDAEKLIAVQSLAPASRGRTLLAVTFLMCHRAQFLDISPARHNAE